MNKEVKLTINNLIYALLFLVFGIILLTSTQDLIGIVSIVIGAILIAAGIIKCIIYIYMKGKLGEYRFSDLAVGLLIIFCGVLLIVCSGALSFAIRTVVGLWALFSGINRMILAISTRSIDKSGFMFYLLIAFVMIIVGVLLISGILDKMLGLLIIIYAITEIVGYIYYKVKYKDNEPVTSNKKETKQKKLKSGKVVDAVIEEEEEKEED